MTTYEMDLIHRERIKELIRKERLLYGIANAWERWQYLSDRSLNGDEIHEAWLTHLALMDALKKEGD